MHQDVQPGDRFELWRNVPSVRFSARYLQGNLGVYYERLDPDLDTMQVPMVMIHGGAHSGACFLTTVDDRPGWAYRAIAAGYPVVLPDWPGSGRSGFREVSTLDGAAIVAAMGQLLEAIDGSVILVTHSMSGPYGWKLIERYGPRIRAVVAVSPGMPGNIQPVPTVLTHDTESIVIQGPTRQRRILLRDPAIADRSTVLQKFIGSSTRFPIDTVDHYQHTLQPIAPRLVYERQNIASQQLRVENAAYFQGKPILVTTGSDDTDHPRELDGAIVEWLKTLGACADFDYLPASGIMGNGHMMMMEANSDEIMTRILAWLEAVQAKHDVP